MNSRACTCCLDAGYIRCLYPNSVQGNLPVCEDEIAMQDLLDFDSTTGSGHNEDLYAFKTLDVAPGHPSKNLGFACNNRLHNEMVDITGDMLDGQQILKATLYHRLTLIQGLR